MAVQVVGDTLVRAWLIPKAPGILEAIPWTVCVQGRGLPQTRMGPT